MPTTASWGPKSFVIEVSKIIPFSGLKITQSVKTETQTSSGSSVVNMKGKDAMNVAFTTTYLAAAGVDPYAHLEEWLSLIGQSHPLYIGGKRIGPQKLTLQSVEVSNTRHTNKGEFLGIDVAIALKEYATEQTTKNAASSGSSSGKKKSKAMNATASKSDKAQRSPRKAKRGGSGTTNNKVVMLN